MDNWLREFLENFVKFKNEEWNFFVEKGKNIELKSKDIFLKHGEIANKVGYLKKGILRARQHNCNGNVSTSYFYSNPNNIVVTLATSFILKNPSEHCIEAITDCEILYFERNHIDECLKKYTVFETLVRKLAEEQYIQASRRVQDLQMKSAKERYNDFARECGDLILKVPQNMIASYLGMSQFTLSKIKK